MWIVTGGAGFIGSALVRALNARGEDRILVVEQLQDHRGLANLDGCRFVDAVESSDFRRDLAGRGLAPSVRGILHQGACTDTMVDDRRRMYDANVAFSTELLRAAQSMRVPFVYASSAAVYGISPHFEESADNEAPLNLYGHSKRAFDSVVRRETDTSGQTVVGLRYFNVYGSREQHKGRMASMVHQLSRQLTTTGEMRLFGAHDGLGPGEQRRDFVHVDDVAAVNLHFLLGPARQDIVNVGTGASRSFNTLARILRDQAGIGTIRYIPFPASLSGRYQSHTCADITRLRQHGYEHPFLGLEEGIARTVTGRDDA